MDRNMENVYGLKKERLSKEKILARKTKSLFEKENVIMTPT